MLIFNWLNDGSWWVWRKAFALNVKVGGLSSPPLITCSTSSQQCQTLQVFEFAVEHLPLTWMSVSLPWNICTVPGNHWVLLVWVIAHAWYPGMAMVAISIYQRVVHVIFCLALEPDFLLLLDPMNALYGKWIALLPRVEMAFLVLCVCNRYVYNVLCKHMEVLIVYSGHSVCFPVFPVFP